MKKKITTNQRKNFHGKNKKIKKIYTISFNFSQKYIVLLAIFYLVIKWSLIVLLLPIILNKNNNSTKFSFLFDISIIKLAPFKKVLSSATHWKVFQKEWKLPIWNLHKIKQVMIWKLKTLLAQIDSFWNSEIPTSIFIFLFFGGNLILI